MLKKKGLIMGGSNGQSKLNYKQEHKSVETPTKHKKKCRKAIIITVIGLVLVVVIICLTPFVVPFIRYQSALNDYKNGDYDNAIGRFILIEDYSDSTEKLIEVKMAKGAYLMGNKMYDEAISVYEDLKASSIYDEQKSMAEELIKECEYKMLLDAIKINPDLDSVFELYLYAKTDYKNSREQLDSICTSEWLFSKLTFSNIDTNIYYFGDLTDEYDGEVYVYGSILDIKAKFIAHNASPFPMGGSINVTLEVYDGIYGGYGVTRTVVFALEEVLQPGESKSCETQTWRYDWEGDDWELIGGALFGVFTDSNGLRIVYD